VSVSQRSHQGFDSRFPIPGSRIKAHVAQLVEHVLGKDEVTSSILVVGSMKTGNGKGESGLEERED
jgi:hypothetical protein